MSLNEARLGLLVAIATLIFQIIAVIQNRKPRKGRKRRTTKRRIGRHRKR